MMSGVAHNLDQEYWRPPVQSQASPAEVIPTEVCPRCNTDFVVGARFCHVCGGEREAQPDVATPRFARFLDFQLIRQSLGLTAGALVAFFVGLVCAVLAALQGVMWTATTTLDWQAIQAWRIEWLLAALAAFACGILLKRPA